MVDPGMSKSDPSIYYFPPGSFPMQCGGCGRELIMMCCKKCAPYTPPAVKNRGGFPKFGQLSPVKSTINFSPTSPRKRTSGPGFMAPQPIRQVQFGEVTKRYLEVTVDGECTTGGLQKPFLRRVGEGRTFTVLTKFEWSSHKWETRDVPCNRHTSEAMLRTALEIHFERFVKEMDECSNSHACLCGGPNSPVTVKDIEILGYDLFIIDNTFTIIVKAGLGV